MLYSYTIGMPFSVILRCVCVCVCACVCVHMACVCVCVCVHVAYVCVCVLSYDCLQRLLLLQTLITGLDFICFDFTIVSY